MGLSLVAAGRDYSLVRVPGLVLVSSLAAEHGLESKGTVVVARGLSCLIAGGNFLDQGSNTCFLYWHVDS